MTTRVAFSAAATLQCHDCTCMGQDCTVLFVQYPLLCSQRTLLRV